MPTYLSERFFFAVCDFEQLKKVGAISVTRGGLVCLNSAARFDKWSRAAVR